MLLLRILCVVTYCYLVMESLLGSGKIFTRHVPYYCQAMHCPLSVLPCIVSFLDITNFILYAQSCYMLNPARRDTSGWFVYHSIVSKVGWGVVIYSEIIIDWFESQFRANMQNEGKKISWYSLYSCGYSSWQVGWMVCLLFWLNSELVEQDSD